MAEYLILLYEDEKAWATADEELVKRVVTEHQAFRERYGEAVLGGARLTPTTTATSLRPDVDGGFTVTDGPFGESKEVLAGFYRVAAADLDEALEMAKLVPAHFGGLEVRPVWQPS